jgi:hypothetical protein
VGASSWDNVVDFRWHKSTHSPCWHVIPDDRRIRTVQLKELSVIAAEYMTTSCLGDRVTQPEVNGPSTPSGTEMPPAGTRTVNSAEVLNPTNDDEDEI